MAFVTESVWNFTKELKWLDKYLEGHNGFIAGGFAKQIFKGERIKDLDIFFHNAKDFNAAVEWYGGSTSYDRLGEKGHEDDRIDFYYENENVHAFRHMRGGKSIMVLELNQKIFGSPQEILSQFDFTIAKFAFFKHWVYNKPGPDGNPWLDENDNDMHEEQAALYHEKFFEHLTLNRLVIDDQCLYPSSTMERTYKFGKRGYFPCRATMIKLVQALRAMPEEEVTRFSLYLNNGLD